MGRACVLMVFLLPVAVAAVPARPAAAAEPATPLKIGLPESLFSGLPPALVQTASRPFQRMLERQSGLKGEVAVGRDYADLADQLRAGKLDVALFHGFEFAWVKGDPQLVPLVVSVPASKLQAVLVVSAGSKAKTPHDLMGEAVAVPAATKAHCHLYFERLKATLPAGCCGVAKLKGRTIEDALDAVSDEQCPAALVDAGALSAYQKLKPGAGEQLKVLAQSEPFPPAVIVCRKDAFTAAAAKKVCDGLVRCVDTAEGQQLTSLWRIKGFERAGPRYQIELDNCLKAYPVPEKK